MNISDVARQSGLNRSTISLLYHEKATRVDLDVLEKLWKQITPSDYAWEREALEFAKDILPDHDPYRAWANFEFIALDGSINEIDLMVLTLKGLFLIEIKSHPGIMRGDAGTWVWGKPIGGRKIFDNPRILTDRKAKKLASLLQVQLSVTSSTQYHFTSYGELDTTSVKEINALNQKISTAVNSARFLALTVRPRQSGVGSTEFARIPGVWLEGGLDVLQSGDQHQGASE